MGTYGIGAARLAVARAKGTVGERLSGALGASPPGGRATTTLKIRSFPKESSLPQGRGGGVQPPTAKKRATPSCEAGPLPPWYPLPGCAVSSLGGATQTPPPAPKTDSNGDSGLGHRSDATWPMTLASLRLWVPCRSHPSFPRATD